MILKNISIDAIEFDNDDIKDQVQTHFFPEEVFDFEVLKQWAFENGFIQISDGEDHD